MPISAVSPFWIACGKSNSVSSSSIRPASVMADATDIVREMINAWNAHDPDGVARHVSNDFVSESDTLPAAVRGPDAVRQEVEMYVRAFSDLHFEIEQMLSSGDYVTMRWTAVGTHDGELMGIRRPTSGL